jgi:peptide/nickel transport system permease protein
MGVIVWSPLAGGWLTGKYRRGEEAPTDSRMVRSRERAGRVADRFDLHPNVARHHLDQPGQVEWGGRLVPLVVVGLAIAIGVPLGLIAGYRGGWLDEAIMRVADMFLAFPPLLLAMVIVSLLGPSLWHAALALAIAWWPWYARLVRGMTASLRTRPFVEGARTLGLRDSVVLVRHVLPNASSPILVQATVDVGTVILAMGGLAFLGLGAQPPVADWGLMVAEGRVNILSHWWVATFAGLAIFVAVLGFNLLGDALRNILDPREVAR